MFRRVPSWLLALALLALAWAQVFGMARGYLCDCHGSFQVSLVDHCHAVADPCCHEAGTSPHSHSDEDGETHEHEPLKESVQARNLEGPTVASPVLWMAVASLPAGLPVRDLAACHAHARRSLPEELPAYRRWPQVLTHQVALRI